MLTVNYTYRIYPNVVQQTELRSWLETCTGVYNYALRELKDWIASRKCSVDRCSLEKEYIIPADEPFPSYQRQQNNLPKAKKQFPHLGKVHSQVLQTTIRRLHDTWEAFKKRGHGFPRFKKFGQLKSFLFPQFKNNPINGFTIKLPKLGEVPINLHRPFAPLSKGGWGDTGKGIVEGARNTMVCRRYYRIERISSRCPGSRSGDWD